MINFKAYFHCTLQAWKFGVLMRYLIFFMRILPLQGDHGELSLLACLFPVRGDRGWGPLTTSSQPPPSPSPWKQANETGNGLAPRWVLASLGQRIHPIGQDLRNSEQMYGFREE